MCVRHDGAGKGEKQWDHDKRWSKGGVKIGLGEEIRVGGLED